MLNFIIMLRKVTGWAPTHEPNWLRYMYRPCSHGPSDPSSVWMWETRYGTNCGKKTICGKNVAVSLQRHYPQGEDYKSCDFMHCNQMINIIYHHLKKKWNWTISQFRSRQREDDTDTEMSSTPQASCHLLLLWHHLYLTILSADDCCCD